MSKKDLPMDVGINKVEDKRILYNAIQTPDNTIIESKHRHDFVQYTDKNGQYYSVDGGTDYLRTGYDVADYKDISIYDDGTHETRRKYVKWGVNYDKDMNRLPETLWKPIMDLEIGHIQAILDGNYTNDSFYLEVFNNELKYRENE